MEINYEAIKEMTRVLKQEIARNGINENNAQWVHELRVAIELRESGVYENRQQDPNPEMGWGSFLP